MKGSAHLPDASPLCTSADGRAISSYILGKLKRASSNAFLRNGWTRISDSPRSVPIKNPKATWVEPAVLAEIDNSAITAEKRLRAPVFKGIRDDLMAPRKEPKRKIAPTSSSSPVPESNILQSCRMHRAEPLDDRIHGTVV